MKKSDDLKETLYDVILVEDNWSMKIAQKVYKVVLIAASLLWTYMNLCQVILYVILLCDNSSGRFLMTATLSESSAVKQGVSLI